MPIKFVIPGRLDGLNEYTEANRCNRHCGSKMKQRNQKAVRIAIRKAKVRCVMKYPVHLKITWYEPNSRRDIDNVIFAQKFILDALVDMQVLINDSQRYVKSIAHVVTPDKDNPRIEVEIIERDDEND